MYVGIYIRSRKLALCKKGCLTVTPVFFSKLKHKTFNTHLLAIPFRYFDIISYGYIVSQNRVSNTKMIVLLCLLFELNFISHEHILKMKPCNVNNFYNV